MAKAKAANPETIVEGESISLENITLEKLKGQTVELCEDQVMWALNPNSIVLSRFGDVTSFVVPKTLNDFELQIIMNGIKLRKIRLTEKANKYESIKQEEVIMNDDLTKKAYFILDSKTDEELDELINSEANIGIIESALKIENIEKKRKPVIKKLEKKIKSLNSEK